MYSGAILQEESAEQSLPTQISFRGMVIIVIIQQSKRLPYPENWIFGITFAVLMGHMDPCLAPESSFQKHVVGLLLAVVVCFVVTAWAESTEIQFASHGMLLCICSAILIFSPLYDLEGFLGIILILCMLNASLALLVREVQLLLKTESVDNAFWVYLFYYSTAYVIHMFTHFV